MSCEEIRKLLTKYVQHTANEEEVTKVEEHLCVCHDCRTSLGRLMDELEESREGKISPESKKQEKSENDFEIIPSGPSPEEKIEKPDEKVAEESEPEGKKARQEPEKKSDEKGEAKEKRGEKEKLDQATPIEEKKEPKAEETAEKNKKEQSQSQSADLAKGEDKGEGEEKKKGMEYFPAEDIKTFSEKKSSKKDDQEVGGAAKGQEPKSDLSAPESEPEPEGEEEKKEPQEKDLGPIQEDAEPSFRTIGEELPIRRDEKKDIPPLDEPKPDIIGYLAIGIGVLVLIFLVFLFLQG